MSQQAIFTCDRCGEKFHEVSYNNETRIALTIDFHWNEVSTGHHLKTGSCDLCNKCSKEFAKFIDDGTRGDLREEETPNC